MYVNTFSNPANSFEILKIRVAHLEGLSIKPPRPPTSHVHRHSRPHLLRQKNSSRLPNSNPFIHPSPSPSPSLKSLVRLPRLRRLDTPRDSRHRARERVAKRCHQRTTDVAIRRRQTGGLERDLVRYDG